MPDDPNNPASARILICEDEFLVAEDIALTLRDLGYETAGMVATGEEAIRNAEEVRPDLIMMDINLAGEIDGIEAVEQIRAQFDVPVIYLTAYAEEDVFERAKQTEPYGYVGKPVGLLELRCTVETALYKHQADRRVRESEERFRKVFEQGPIGMGLVGTDGRFFVVNSQLCQMLGYTEDELTRLTFVDITHPDHVTQDLEAVRRLYSGEIPYYKAEKRYIKKDGDILWGNLTATAIRDAEGKLLYTLPMIEDITERRKAEEALRSSESFLKSIIDQSPYPMWISDHQGILIRTNKALRDVLHISDEEVVGKYNVLRDSIVEEQGFLPLVKSVFERGDTVRFEVKYDSSQLKHLQLRQSAFVILDVTIFPIKDSGGKIANAVIQHINITDRKRAEEELRETSRLNQILIDMMPCVAMLLRPHSREIVASNAEAVKVGAVPGSQCFATWGQRENSCPWCLAPKLWETGEAQHLEVEALGIVFDAYWIPVSSDLYMHYAFDVTDQRRAEELALQAARLRAVADISSGVAHHFNNLLQIVMGNASLSIADLESGDLAQVKTSLEKMLEAATFGAETVKRLQTFANVRADVTESESDVFDMAATARNAAEVSQPFWKSDPEKRGIKVDLQLDLQDGCLVKGQENEMFEVLVNLIRNAAEALLDGGDMEVKAFNEADEVVIAVRDSGTGIAEEDLSKVFQPFWSSKGVGIGKGMGLAVSHGLVKRHGGSISVDSKLGVETTFTIRLPLAHEPVKKTEEPAIRPAEGHLTILVIDDDVNIASLLERICAKEGHRVFRALSGEEGLAIFNKEPVDLVISDLGMPGMNGWDLGKAIRSICKERGVYKPPFILLTGWGGQELEKERIADSGVDAVVAKPIDRATVLATVQEIAARL